MIARNCDGVRRTETQRAPGRPLRLLVMIDEPDEDKKEARRSTPVDPSTLASAQRLAERESKRVAQAAELAKQSSASMASPPRRSAWSRS